MSAAGQHLAVQPSQQVAGQLYRIGAAFGLPSQLLVGGVLRWRFEFAQYLSIRYTERLADEQAVVSVGSRGDSYDNALAESVIGLFKTEVVKKQGPWRSFEQLELATARWVDWYNNRRLHTGIGDVPPAEFEATYYANSTTVDAA